MARVAYSIVIACVLGNSIIPVSSVPRPRFCHPGPRRILCVTAVAAAAPARFAPSRAHPRKYALGMLFYPTRALPQMVRVLALIDQTGSDLATLQVLDMACSNVVRPWMCRQI